MAKEEFRDEIPYGLEIEIAGEVREGGVEPEADAEALAGDLWGLSTVERGLSQWLAWRAAVGERVRSRGREVRRSLTWRVAAWVAGAALLGFGIGVAGEPAAKQTAARYQRTDFDLHFDNQPITAPGLARMSALAGAAWSVSPVTTLVVHVVNDGSMTLSLHSGTLSGKRISNGTLVPVGTGVLAPGQRGTLNAQVTLSCTNTPADAVESPAAIRPLTADIPVSTDGGPTSIVQLVSGSPQDDLYIAAQLCAGLPAPLAFSFQKVPGTAPQGGAAIQLTVHNITDQTMRYAPELSFQPVDTAEMKTIAPRATVAINIPLAQICPTPSEAYISPSAGLYMSTVNGSYQASLEVAIESNRLLAQACDS